ncbi:hypothetical protein SFUMM280S_03268 [Streptomyces fumanus]
MCCRTSQSKISAPPPVSDSRPASISSSRISEADRPLIVSKLVDLGRGERLQRHVRQRGLQLPQRATIRPSQKKKPASVARVDQTNRAVVTVWQARAPQIAAGMPKRAWTDLTPMRRSVSTSWQA